ncbi:hypothetical protein JTB14_000354 [Gonioctena quinquepunctata]|nr:hypothetical protein JTB14_000354 [Gonioctena quinquepunctata]
MSSSQPATADADEQHGDDIATNFSKFSKEEKKTGLKKILNRSRCDQVSLTLPLKLFSVWRGSASGLCEEKKMTKPSSKRNLVYPVKKLAVRENVLTLAKTPNDEFGQKNSNEEYQFTMEELMEQIEGDSLPHPGTIRRHLLQKYGGDILVTTSKPYVICFRATGQKIINESWYRNVQRLPEKEGKHAIVEAVTAVII